MKYQSSLRNTAGHRDISEARDIDNNDTSVSRRRFIKGLGLLAIASHIPQLVSATCGRDFSTVVHIGGESSGLFLRQGDSQFGFGQDRTSQEFWSVDSRGLVQVSHCGRTVHPYMIREIGSQRTGFIGTFLLHTDEQGLDHEIQTLIKKAKKLREAEGCGQVFCIIDVPTTSMLREKEITEMMCRSQYIDQWFVTLPTDGTPLNKVKCLRDDDNKQVMVSLKAKAFADGQQLVYQYKRLSYISSTSQA